MSDKSIKEIKFEHREFRDDEFWRNIPAWSSVSKEEFLDHKWQSKNSIRKFSQLGELLGDLVTNEFLADIEAGLKLAPMNIRITPYVFSLFNWQDPENDPLRKQFLPLASQFLPDHPFYLEDSLAEDVDSPVPMLTHRYPDKVLFLPLTTCPVYCAYCTRSRIIGGSTDTREKNTYGANEKNWEKVFEYLRGQPQVEDVVISGGDAYNLQAKQIELIGETLLNIPHIRRIRYATKGLAIFPMKILTDDDWFLSVVKVAKLGRELGKQVVIHTHFSSPNEITYWSKLAMDRLFAEGIVVRNQAVLQSGVNNDPKTMILLNRKLGFMNIQPYYVYMHDMVPGCEHLRTTLAEGVEIEKHVRGTTAGFNTPKFVCDAPGGGGKRQIDSFEYYDKENGISVWIAPSVKPNNAFVYLDPIHKLSKESQKRWQNERESKVMIIDALAKADLKLMSVKSVFERFKIGY